MSEQPFQTLRSLVVMTMGARKRAARRWLWPDDNRRDALRMFRDMAAEWKNNYEKYEYGLARKPYRIGQRLRPCPGCHACMPGVKGWHIDKVRGRFKMPTVAWSCDGSGVLPAKKAKAAK